MTLVSQSMYMDPKSAPLAGRTEPPGQEATPGADTAPKECRWCGKPLVNPRRNQACCNAECREAWERSKRARSKQAAAEKPKGTCLWCDGPFDRKHKHQDFCCPDHQQAFNNFWKGKGPMLAKALHAWRVGKAKGGLTDVCREFSMARDELKDKRAKAAAKRKGER